MTRDSTQLVAAVTTVLVILISITVVTELVSDNHPDTIRGEWYLGERYFIDDGGGVEHDDYALSDVSECLNIITLSGEEFTGTFSGEEISGTFLDDTISFYITEDGIPVRFSGELDDGIITVSSIWIAFDGSIRAEEMAFSRDGNATIPPIDLPDTFLFDVPSMQSEDEPSVPKIIDSGGHIVITEDGNGSTYILMMDDDGSGGYGIISSGATSSEIVFTLSEGTISI